MLKTIILIAVVSRLCDARPNTDEFRNVVTVPPNCPPGQEYINGQCRDIWLLRNNQQVLVHDDSAVNMKNVVTVPPNCAPGQEYINGQCRDIWFRATARDSSSQLNLFDKIVAASQSIPFSGGSVGIAVDSSTSQLNEKNIVTVPSQCPEGYRPDTNGICREIWSREIPTIIEENMQ